MDAPISAEAEAFVRSLIDDWLAPHPHECLACYLDRAVATFGCSGDLRLAQRYRDRLAPRATALERRLEAGGGFCDCEVLMNAIEPAHRLWESPPRMPPLVPAAPDADAEDDTLGDDADWYDDRYDEAPELEPPVTMPPCRGVRRGSTQPCGNWQLRWRPPRRFRRAWS
ncbi:DUF2695 domain-containing protein [Agrococcus sp. ProA11]|uniref:DUF2695 domain-containing protein n=1 Tax=Agrococcus chionoecetis TaxID=3153752 RepID=UPI003260C226